MILRIFHVNNPDEALDVSGPAEVMRVLLLRLGMSNGVITELFNVRETPANAGMTAHGFTVVKTSHHE